MADAATNMNLRKPLRIASYPGLESGNPYLELFYGALRVEGLVHAGPIEFSRGWLDRQTGNIEVLHFHWAIENLWRRYLPTWLERLKGVIGERRLWRPSFHNTGVDHLSQFLADAKKMGFRLVWTCHEVEPYEDVTDVDTRGYALVARSADLILVHSEWGRRALERRFSPPGEIVVSPIGSYDGCFPDPRPREATCEMFGIDPDIPLVSCIGYVRPYKGVDIACQAIDILRGEVQLLIAGAAKKLDASELQSHVERVPWATWINRVVTSQEFSDIVHASDALLFPFRKATNSSSLTAALTMQRGAIVSDLPCFTEAYADCGHALKFFRSEDADSLAVAIRQFLRTPPQQRSAAAKRAIRSRSWQQVVRPGAQIMRRWRPTPVA